MYDDDYDEERQEWYEQCHEWENTRNAYAEYQYEGGGMDYDEWQRMTGNYDDSYLYGIYDDD